MPLEIELLASLAVHLKEPFNEKDHKGLTNFVLPILSNL